MSENKSQHILNSASNLLGFCLIVMTSLKISKYSEQTFIDEFTGATCLLLVLSTLFSFFSIRSKNERLINKYEKIADNIFILSLIFIFLITIMVFFTVVI